VKGKDTFWFYFSGHGKFVPADDTSYLIPADVNRLDAVSGLSVRELRSLLTDNKGERTLLFPRGSGKTASDTQVHSGDSIGIPSDPNRTLRPDTPGEFVVRAYLLPTAESTDALLKSLAG
jgi:hypothetical protein